MFEIKPYYQLKGVPYREEFFLFHGKVFLERNPESANQEFQSLPIGHCAYFPIQFSLNGSADYPPEADHWLARPLIQAVLNHESTTAELNIVRRTSKKSVVIINCLDDCFGHVVYKLFSVSRHRQADLGIVVIIPNNVAYYIPDDVEEVWTVNGRLADMNKEISGLDNLLKKELQRFEKVYFSHAFPRPNLETIHFKEFLKIDPFDLSAFDTEAPRITFVFRADRPWISRQFDQLVLNLCNRFGVQWGKYLLATKQIRHFNKVAEQVKKRLPTSTFSITGFGKMGNVGSLINDLRVDKATDASEAVWNEVYAQSHLVIGVHGSAMMIPTQLAAGFICLVPHFKLDHWAEDTLPPNRGRLSLFLCRFLDICSTPKMVAGHAISMLTRFKLHNRADHN